MFWDAPKSTREWLLVVSVIVLLETIFFHVVYAYGHDANVRDAWNFAGTIVSIILAVVAIIYSFIQSIGQTTSSQELSRQVENLKEVVSTVGRSTTDLSGGMADLKRLAHDFDKVGAGVVDQGKHIAAISSKLDKLGDQGPKSTPPRPVKEGGVGSLDKDTVQLWLRALSENATDATYILYRHDGHSWDFGAAARLFQEASTENRNEKVKKRSENKPLWSGYHGGILSATKSIYAAMGQIDVDKEGVLRVRLPLKDAMTDYFNQDPEALGYTDEHVPVFTKLKELLDTEFS
jgi:hypothetical protein